MKYLLILSIVVLLFGCKKDSVSSNETLASSQWNIDNVTYKPTYTTVIDNSEIFANDANGNSITITFGYTINATTNYTVTAAPMDDFVATHCNIQLDIKGNPNTEYWSTGMGGTVSISSSNSGIVATLSNVSMRNQITSQVTVLTGTIIQ